MRLASYIAAPNTSYILSIQKYLTEARALIEKEWPTPGHFTKEAIYMETPGEFTRMLREKAVQQGRDLPPSAPVFWSRKKDLYACPSCFVLVHDKDMVNHTRWHDRS